jgi:transposase
VADNSVLVPRRPQHSAASVLLRPDDGFFNKIKHCRRIATRYDKLAANYLAFVELASIRLWLRVYEFTT